MRMVCCAFDLFRRLRVAALAVVITLCAVPMAQSQGGGAVLSATSITGTSAGTGGLSGTLNAVITATEARGYYSTPVTVGWGTLGQAARAGMRGVGRFLPYVGLAMTAAELAGWELDGEWFNKGDGVPSRDLQDGVQYICADPSMFQIDARYCVETFNAQQLASWLIGKGGAGIDQGCTVTTTSVSGGKVRFECYMPNGLLKRYGFTSPIFTVEPTEYRTTEYRAPTLVTETEMVEAMFAQGPTSHYDMLHGTDGKPHQFPEVQSALSAMASTITANGTVPVTVGGEAVDPSTEPPGPPPAPGTSSSELPAFCEWASVVCEFITWYKEPGETLQNVELPEDSGEILEQEWDSGQSGGSCPAPETAAVMGADVEFSYEPICMFATGVRPVLIAGALAIAAFIIAGLRSGRD